MDKLQELKPTDLPQSYREKTTDIDHSVSFLELTIKDIGITIGNGIGVAFFCSCVGVGISAGICAGFKIGSLIK